MLAQDLPIFERFTMFTLSHKMLVVSLLFAHVALGAATSPIIHVTKVNFDKLLESDKPVIIDVYGTWCTPCKQLKPIYHAFAEEHKGKYLCAEIDSDESSELATRLNVSSMPTILVYHKKKLLGRFSGFQSPDVFKSKIEAIINGAQKSLKELTKEQLATKFMEALQSASISEIEKIIAAGVDVNALLPNGMLPIMFAFGNALGGSDQGLPVVKLLLDKGASLKEIDQQGVKRKPREIIANMVTQCKLVIERSTILLEMIDEALAKQNCSNDSCKVA